MRKGKQVGKMEKVKEDIETYITNLRELAKCKWEEESEEKWPLEVVEEALGRRLTEEEISCFFIHKLSGLDIGEGESIDSKLSYYGADSLLTEKQQLHISEMRRNEYIEEYKLSEEEVKSLEDKYKVLKTAIEVKQNDTIRFIVQSVMDMINKKMGRENDEILKMDEERVIDLLHVLCYKQ